MKHFFFIVALIAFRFTSYADIPVYRDTVGGYYYCQIQPTTCAIGRDTVSRMSFVTFSQDEITQCTIAYMMRDTSGITQCSGNITMDGDTYRDFRELCEEEDSFFKAQFIYTFVANRLGITIITD
jgi:hypothetical protein